MSNQAANWLIYQNDKYELLRDTSKQLPMIARFGMIPVSMGTNCYRGYVAEYEIRDVSLFLTVLSVSDKNDNYPVIGNVKPSNGLYEGLSELMTIHSTIVIGKDIPSNWCLGDIRWPHDYETNLKLTLLSGMVQSVEDISEQAGIIRNELREIFDVRLHEHAKGKEPQYKDARIKELYDQSFALMGD